jgi:hypothetical protein
MVGKGRVIFPGSRGWRHPSPQGCNSFDRLSEYAEIPQALIKTGTHLVLV